MANLEWQIIDSKYKTPVPAEQVSFKDTVGIGQLQQQMNNSLGQQVLQRVPQEQPIQSNIPTQMNVQNPNIPVPVNIANTIVAGVNPTAPVKAGNPSDALIQKAVQYGKQYNIDPAVFLAKAQIESNFNTNAGADKKMRYGGLFGLDTKAFGNKVYDMDFAFNETAKQYLQNQQLMKSHGIANPTFGDAYAYYQQGANGANALRKGGNKLAGEVLNPFYKGYKKYATLGISDGFQPIYQNLAITDPKRRAEKAKSITANEFYNYWFDKGNAAYNAWQNDARLIKFRG